MLFTLDKLICRFVKQFQALLADDLAQVICTPLHVPYFLCLLSPLWRMRMHLAIALQKATSFAIYGIAAATSVCL